MTVICAGAMAGSARAAGAVEGTPRYAALAFSLNRARMGATPESGPFVYAGRSVYFCGSAGSMPNCCNMVDESPY